MTNSPQQIENDIASARGQLENDIEELKSRVADAADWKKQFENNTAVAVGLAFGGGLLLASLTRPSYRGAYAQRSSNGGSASPSSSGMGEVLGGLKTALISLASTKVIEAVNDAVPGFAEHYEKYNRSRA